MKVTLRMVSGGSVVIGDMPDVDVMGVVEDYQHGDSAVMSFQLDECDGSAPSVIHLARRHVESLEVGQ